MLFDLRSPGRQLAVKIIYGFLALLIGGGLVFFGIGGAGGSVLDAVKSGDGSVDNKAFVKQADAQERKTTANPTAANYAALARDRVQAARDGYDENSGAFNDDGKAQLQLADSAWTTYLQKTSKPDANLAAVIQSAYQPGALEKYDKGYDAMLVVIDSSDSATWQQYAQLARWAYLANNTREAELARSKTLDVAGKDDLEQAKGALDQFKTQAQELNSSTTASGG